MSTRKILFLVVAAAFILVTVSPVLAGDDKQLTVFAIVKVKSNKAMQARQEMLKLVPLTRLEPGCINYDMHVSVGTTPGTEYTEDPTLYMFYENWRSREDWDLHMQMPYLTDWFNMCNGVGQEPVCESLDITIYEMYKMPTNPVFRGKVLPDLKERYTLSARVFVKSKDDCPPEFPDCADRARKEMLSLVPLTHTEPGCVDYRMHVNLNQENGSQNPLSYLFYENWYDFHVWYYDHMNASYLVRWFDMAPQLTTEIRLQGWRMMNFCEIHNADNSCSYVQGNKKGK